MTIRMWSGVFLSAAMAAACGSSDGDDDDGSDDDVVTAATTLSGDGDDLSAAARAVPSLNQTLGRACPDNLSCLTPATISGGFESFFLRVSSNHAYTDLSILRANDGAPSLLFDFADPIEIPSTFECCEGKSWSATDAHFKDLVWNLGYVDATFENPFNLTGTYTLRFVYGDDAVNGYLRGDILLRHRDGGFRWCDVGTTSAEECSTSRTGITPVTQPASVVNFDPTIGPSYPYLTAELFPVSTDGDPGDEVVGLGVGPDDFTADTWQFDIEFDITGAFGVQREHPGAPVEVDNISDLMSKVFLRGLSPYVDDMDYGGQGIAATLVVAH